MPAFKLVSLLKRILKFQKRIASEFDLNAVISSKPERNLTYTAERSLLVEKQKDFYISTDSLQPAKSLSEDSFAT